jgi:hypothetical protein
MSAHVARLRAAVGHDLLVRLLDVLGGPDYEVTYPNRDRVAYVAAVYTAEIIAGSPVPDGDELSDAAWFAPAALPGLRLSRFAAALLRATRYLEVPP